MSDVDDVNDVDFEPKYFSVVPKQQRISQIIKNSQMEVEHDENGPREW